MGPVGFGYVNDVDIKASVKRETKRINTFIFQVEINIYGT